MKINSPLSSTLTSLVSSIYISIAYMLLTNIVF